MSKKRNRTDLELMSFDQDARMNGPNKKKFHIKDLNYITPLTENQKATFASYNTNLNLFLYGSAGTGKTFLSLYLGLRDVLDEDTPYNRLIILRSCVPTRDIGFLPGDEDEKMEVYEEPYVEICDRLFDYSKSYKNLKSGGYIRFMSTSYLRGITFDNSIVVVDEAQNNTFHELDSIITRMGKNSKIIFCGDIIQSDLLKNKHDVSGLKDFMDIIRVMSEFSMIEFSIDDCVRSGLVRSYLINKEKIESQK